MATKKKTGKTTTDNRKRVFAFPVYPTKEYLDKHYPECQYDGRVGYGTIENQEFLVNAMRSTMWKGFISPLHWCDLDEDASGKIKKPHWHVMIMFGQNSKKDWDTQINPVLDEVLGEKGHGGNINVASAVGYARYLCHIDNPEKAQYDKKDVIAFGGADYLTTINCAEDNNRIQKEIIRFINEYDVLYFNRLVDWCMDNNEEWYQFLSKNCYFIREYLKAKNAEMNSIMANDYTRQVVCEIAEKRYSEDLQRLGNGEEE